MSVALSNPILADVTREDSTDVLDQNHLGAECWSIQGIYNLRPKPFFRAMGREYECAGFLNSQV